MSHDNESPFSGETMQMAKYLLQIITYLFKFNSSDKKPIIALILYYPLLNFVNAHYLRPKGHTYELPRCDSEVYKKSFVPRCLFRYM